MRDQLDDFLPGSLVPKDFDGHVSFLWTFDVDSFCWTSDEADKDAIITLPYRARLPDGREIMIASMDEIFSGERLVKYKTCKCPPSEDSAAREKQLTKNDACETCCFSSTARVQVDGEWMTLKEAGLPSSSAAVVEMLMNDVSVGLGGHFQVRGRVGVQAAAGASCDAAPAGPQHASLARWGWGTIAALICSPFVGSLARAGDVHALAAWGIQGGWRARHAVYVLPGRAADNSSSSPPARRQGCDFALLRHARTLHADYEPQGVVCAAAVHVPCVGVRQAERCASA